MKVTGATFILPNGSSAVVYAGNDGLPARAVFGNVVALFSDYTDSSVDITLVAADGTVTAARGVPVNANTLADLKSLPAQLRASAMSSAGTLALTPRDLQGFALGLKIGGMLIKLASCSALFASGGSLIIGAGACISLVVEVATLINPELDSSLLQASSALMSGATCAGLSPEGCTEIVVIALKGATTLAESVLLSSGTPWSQLPPISLAAKDYLIKYNIEMYRGVTRWTNFPIRIWADPGFRRQDLIDAIDLWQTATSGRVTFAIVDAAAGADIVFTFDSSIDQIPGRCGEEGPTSIQNNVITGGRGRYATSARPECSPNGAWRTGLAHGIGHILGLIGHTASNTDVMSSPLVPFNMSPLLSEIVNWLYSVPAGTKPR